jgi:hypothetical protein
MPEILRLADPSIIKCSFMNFYVTLYELYFWRSFTSKMETKKMATARSLHFDSKFVDTVRQNLACGKWGV